MIRKLFIFLVLFPFLAFAGTLTIQPILEQTNTWTSQQTMPSVKLTTGATDGYVLTSDAAGVGSWEASVGGGGGGGDIYAPVGSVVGDCKLSVAGFTLTIDAGTVCLIGAKLNAAGEHTTLSITSNEAITFGAASNTDLNNFGISMNDDWDETMIWFLSIIMDSANNHLFALSKVPMSASGTDVSSICELDSTDCDDSLDLMLVSTGETLSNWVDQPVTTIGWFGGTLTTAEIHTFTLPKGSGFNKDWLKYRANLPTGVQGASSGKYCDDDGGVCPEFTENLYVGGFGENGKCWASGQLNGDGGADGGGGVYNLPMHTRSLDPFTGESVAGSIRPMLGYIMVRAQQMGASCVNHCLPGTFESDTLVSDFRCIADSCSSSIRINNSRFISGERSVAFQLEWDCYK